MYPTPTLHTIDPHNGALSGATGRYEKKLSDLSGVYADEAVFKRACETSGDSVVYYVHETRPSSQRGDLIFGTTFMEPGTIGGEFFATRGHIHARANRPEIYYGERGRGLMLMENPEGETRILELAPQILVYVPPMWIHRSVNIGTEPLVMSFTYPADAGQDYDIIAQSGGMAKRIVVDQGGGWKAIDNAGYRPRTDEQIAAILATRD